MEFSVELLFALFLVAVVAGWVDTLAGGGGLIVLPALLFAGVPPLQALATNKCQGFVGTFTATATLYAKGRLTTKGLWKLMLLTAIGASAGTWLIQHVDTQWLRYVVPVLLLLVAGYLFCFPNLGAYEGKSVIKESSWAKTLVPAIGFYDGFFGPGTGSFFAASRVIFLGKTLTDATILAKPLNFTSNIVSLFLFAFGGQVVWTIGLIMMFGQVIGAWFGTQSIFWGGVRLIRPLVIIVCVAMSIHQLWVLHQG